METSNRVYTRISKHWHKLKTAQGVFFGTTREIVEGKAATAARFESIALQEQAAYLSMSDAQRGVRA